MYYGMKCPKCGSELDTVFNCPKCKAKSYKEIVSEYNTNGEKIYEKNTVKLVQPEPTAAEMLWWLVENGYTIYRYPHKTLEEAVRTAYEKAKEKEDER